MLMDDLVARTRDGYIERNGKTFGPPTDEALNATDSEARLKLFPDFVPEVAVIDLKGTFSVLGFVPKEMLIGYSPIATDGYPVYGSDGVTVVGRMKFPHPARNAP